MKTLRFQLTTTEEMLGMSPSDKEIYDNFIASNNPEPSTENESDYIPDNVDAKGKTIFPVLEDGTPFFWDYQIKGFFKDACGMLARVVEKDEKGKKKAGITESAKLTSYKKVIDGLVFVFPRKIPIILPEGVIDMETCQRPLRAQTAQGERIALASSDSIPAGATITFDVKLLSDDIENALLEWLDYGELRGLGQWRNSGKGTFTYKIVQMVDGVTLDYKSLRLKVGQSNVLEPTVSPENADNKSVTWSSSNTDVVNVNNSGEILAVGKGSAVITVTTVDGNKTASCTVKVI